MYTLEQYPPSCLTGMGYSALYPIPVRQEGGYCSRVYIQSGAHNDRDPPPYQTQALRLAKVLPDTSASHCDENGVTVTLVNGSSCGI